MLTVLITRPRPQGEALCEAMQAVGYKTVYFPTMDIHATTLQQAEALKKINAADIIVFISANAAQYASKLLAQASITARIACIGKATAAAVKDQGLSVDILSRSMNSEGLLACDELQSLQGKRVLMIRGKGGREFLGQTLGRRGAHVDYLEVYERRKTTDKLDPASLEKADIVLVTSQEGLMNLVHLIPGRSRAAFYQKTVLVSSQRLADFVCACGFLQQVVIAASPCADALIEALQSVSN
jgi:uroporphyrinogen-III synthase